MTAVSGIPPRRYRMASWVMWRTEMVLSLIFAILDTFLHQWTSGEWRFKPIPIPWRDALLVAAFFGFLCLLFPIYVHKWGLRARDDHGTYRDVTWREMDVVRQFDFLGMKVLRVRVSGMKGAVWVPLFLIGRRRFADSVIDLASLDHSLAIKLRKYQSKQDLLKSERLKMGFGVATDS